MSRVNPFEDLSDFAPKTEGKAKPVEAAQIERLAADNNFPSRQPAGAVRKAPAVAPVAPVAASVARPVETEAARPRRRYTTGRNQQLNVKATADTIARFYRLADERHVPLGELLDQALKALEHTGTRA